LTYYCVIVLFIGLSSFDYVQTIKKLLNQHLPTTPTDILCLQLHKRVC